MKQTNNNKQASKQTNKQTKQTKKQKNKKTKQNKPKSWCPKRR